MSAFFTFLDTHANGILVLIILLFALAFFLRHLSRTFGWGLYKNTEEPASENRLGYLVGQFFVRIIDDFRNFLALLMVFLFSALLIYAMSTGDSSAEKMDALKTVVAALGGLIGSIIGYYYGESAARGRQNDSDGADDSGDGNAPEQNNPSSQSTNGDQPATSPAITPHNIDPEANQEN